MLLGTGQNAFRGIRNPIRFKNLSRRFLPFYAAVGVLLLAVRPTKLEWAVGSGLVLAGALLRSWGAGHLVKTERLTCTGPYAHLRHPLYAGTLLAGLGLALTAGGWAAPAILAALLPWFFLDYLPRKERSEARRLELRHGAEFAAYRAAVPALLPRLSAWRPARSASHRRRSWSLERYSENNELGALLALVACPLAFALRAWSVV